MKVAENPSVILTDASSPFRGAKNNPLNHCYRQLVAPERGDVRRTEGLKLYVPVGARLKQRRKTK